MEPTERLDSIFNTPLNLVDSTSRITLEDVHPGEPEFYTDSFQFFDDLSVVIHGTRGMMVNTNRNLVGIFSHTEAGKDFMAKVPSFIERTYEDLFFMDIMLTGNMIYMLNGKICEIILPDGETRLICRAENKEDVVDRPYIYLREWKFPDNTNEYAIYIRPNLEEIGNIKIIFHD